MDLGLTGKAAFVAASSQGLGRSVALELATEGCRVAISGRNAETLAATRKELEALRPTKDILAIECDLIDTNSRRQAVEKAIETFGGIDILVTNSGGPPAGRFEDFELSDWQSAYDLLLASAVDMISRCLPGMKARNFGRIVTITSQAIKQPVGGLILSNSVRVSIAGLVKTLSQEVGAHGITVNNVMPGYTRTARLERLMASNPDFGSVTEEIPLGRLGEPAEFAAAVTFLASERASYITGTSLAVDGGWIKNVL